MTPFSFIPAGPDDFDRLAALRLHVMRESLERVGRFNPERNRDYFRTSFRPDHTRLIAIDGQFAGCVAFGPWMEKLLLEHFYLTPEWQGRGLGGSVLAQLLNEADEHRLPVRLTVLKGSDAERFYTRRGFTPVGSEGVDIFMERLPGVNRVL